MDMKLRVVSGKNAGQEIRVPGKIFLIGRSSECHLRAGSDMISRQHCQLSVADSHAAVKDMGSRNGTFVNGQQITGEVQLKAGDKLKVGPLEFEIVLATGLTGKKLPPVHSVKEAAARSADSSMHTEDDIAKWLMDDQGSSAPAQQVTRETQQLRMGDTEAIRVAAAAKPAPAAAPGAEEPEDADGNKGLFGGVPKPKKVFGKLPASAPEEKAKDSREAAKRMIEQMMKKK